VRNLKQTAITLQSHGNAWKEPARVLRLFSLIQYGSERYRRRRSTSSYGQSQRLLKEIPEQTKVDCPLALGQFLS
jgi:hypothetical protein